MIKRKNTSNDENAEQFKSSSKRVLEISAFNFNFILISYLVISTT